jgi:hypothetical protein
MTSKACPACVRIKQGKERLPGGHLWGPELFRKMTGTGHWKLYLINFDSGQRPSNINSASSITEWSISGPTTYEPEGKRCVMIGPGTIRQYLSLDWPSRVTTLIPEDILHMLMVWPTIGYFSAENWYAGIAKTKPLFGYFPPMQMKRTSEGHYIPSEIPTPFKHEDPIVVMASLEGDPKPLHLSSANQEPTGPAQDPLVQRLGYKIVSSR